MKKRRPTNDELSRQTQRKLLDAALRVIRMKGYSATSVDDICRAAGLTKGSFFHHYRSKQELAIAAAQHFQDMANALFRTAAFHEPTDPLERVLGYVDFRKSIVRGAFSDFTCLLGTMVQEAYDTHPAIRDACGRHITDHAAMVAEDIALAKVAHARDAIWSAESLGLFTQAVMQGAFILAKAANDPRVAADCVTHLHRYIELLFQTRSTQGDKTWPAPPSNVKKRKQTSRSRSRGSSTRRASKSSTRGSRPHS